MDNKTYRKTLLIFLLALFTYTNNYAQESKEDKKQKKYTEIENLINSKNYVFIAQTASPMGRRAINLTSTYEVTISGDTVVSDLPYFGRAFVAPMDPSEGGIHFTSTKFDYNAKETKKGYWDIAILPKDAKDVKQMYLTITESGYGNLEVISNNRQQISYRGYITKRDNS